MKSSSVEKAFADPQSLAVTAKVAAGLKDQLQKTPLQVEQRQQQLKRQKIMTATQCILWCKCSIIILVLA
jgi:hypothetical protein